jgi:hypothetical protein
MPIEVLVEAEGIMVEVEEGAMVVELAGRAIPIQPSVLQLSFPYLPQQPAMGRSLFFIQESPPLLLHPHWRHLSLLSPHFLQEVLSPLSLL